MVIMEYFIQIWLIVTDNNKFEMSLTKNVSVSNVRVYEESA